MERERGYYWIKHSGHWTVADYCGHPFGWFVIGSDENRDDEDFDEIDERKLTHE